MKILSNPKIIYLFLLCSTSLGLIQAIWLIDAGSMHSDFLEKQAGYTLTTLAALLFFRRQIFHLLSIVAQWVQRPVHTRARRRVLAVCLFLACTYQSKAFLGFWFAGIGSWDFTDWRLRFRQIPADFERQVVPAYLNQAIVHKNARFLPQTGHLSGPAMFLHYSNGQVLPANEELLGTVFPRYLLKERFTEDKLLSHAFLGMIRKNVTERRVERRFLLPTSVAYPPHTPYMPISYKGHPNPRSLEGVSWWTIVVELREHKIPQVVTAIKLHSIGETG